MKKLSYLVVAVLIPTSAWAENAPVPPSSPSPLRPSQQQPDPIVMALATLLRECRQVGDDRTVALAVAERRARDAEAELAALRAKHPDDAATPPAPAASAPSNAP